MSFDSSGMYIDRGQFNNSTAPTQLGQHSYKTALDNFETITSNIVPYFPPYLGSTEENVLIGDTLLISCPDGFGRFVLLETSPALVITAQEGGDAIFDTLTLRDVPNNNLDTKVLMLNSSTDEVEWRDVSTLPGGNPFDQDLNTTDTPEFVGLTLSAVANDDTENKLLVLDTATSLIQYRTVASLPAANPFDQDLNTTDDATFNSITLPTTGATADQLDFYTQSEPFVLAFSGPFAAPVNVNCVATRIGNIVSLRIPAFSGNATIAAQITTTLPAWVASSFVGNTEGPLIYANEDGVLVICTVIINGSTLSIIKLNNISGGIFLNTAATLAVAGFPITYII